MKDETTLGISPFADYRLQKGYSARTIKSQDSYLRKFNGWLARNGILLQQVNAQTLLSYISHERKEGVLPGNLKNRLQAIRVYLDYQVTTGTITVNPATSIRLQDKQHTSLFPPIDEGALQDIYKSFTVQEPPNPHKQLLHQRDSVVLGLMVFQGLDSGDLERLTTKDVNLAEGTIYIASSRKNAARTLKLESLQILSINRYLTHTRDQLNEKQESMERFLTKSKVNDLVSSLVTRLRKKHPEIQNPRHIRSSVIMNWLRKYHIRQVQYMAGHKRVCSTERYKREDLHDLTQQFLKYHPIR